MKLMKRHCLCLLAAGFFVLGLGSCADAPPRERTTPAAEENPPVQETILPTPSPTPAPVLPPVSFQVQQADVPPGEYAPWQETYAAFLSELRQKEGELKNWMDVTTTAEQDEDMERWLAYCHSSEEYSLCDVDKDGVPELFIKYGDHEAGYHTVCYTFREGQVEEIGMLYSGHSSLYTWPEENGVILYCAHQGLAYMEKYGMEDGLLASQGRFFEEEIWGTDKEYTGPEEVVPGAEYVASYYSPTHWRPGDSPALLLPIYDYGAPPRQADPDIEESEVRSAIGEVLWEGAPLFGVSGNGFDGDTGWTTLSGYLGPEGIFPYGEESLTVTEYTWADVNGDGQTDCILRLGEYGDHTVLSWQDGTVYAYFFSSLGGFGVDPDGSVYLQDKYGGSWTQSRFYKNQAYRIYFAVPVEGCDLAWDPFEAEKP